MGLDDLLDGLKRVQALLGELQTAAAGLPAYVRRDVAVELRQAADRLAGSNDPPGGLEARLRAIARVLAEGGPMLPHAIEAELRWGKTYLSSALSRQQRLPEPWFKNTQPGWALTDHGRSRLAGG